MSDCGGPPPNWAECRETALSAVFLAGDRVLKFKKPVRTALVDLTSLEERESACQEETRLNTRLSPDVYLGVAHVGLHDAGPGEPVVVMRRLQERDQLAQRMTSGAPASGEAVSSEQIRALARCLTVFHSECAVHDGPHSPGSWESVRQAWLRELGELELLGDVVTGAVTGNRIRSLGLFYLDGRRPLFDDRRRTGQVREGHGDLRCEHVYLTDDGVRIIDCVPFDQTLRIADVVSDLAVLVTDLERLGSPDGAADLLATYRELSGCTYPSSLLDY
jgi:aminoglycoside phosphotransferase family enzyme